MSRETRRTRTSYYVPPSRGNSSSHSVLGYWVPLVVTGTIAIGGLAAWAWSERTEDDEDNYPGPKPQRPPTGQGNPYPTQGSQPYPGPPPPQQAPSGVGSVPPAYPGGPAQAPPPGGEAASYYQQESRSRDVYASGQEQYDESGWYGRVQGVVRRTPSPQQFFDYSSKQVSAGIAAAGAALGSIVEEERDDDYEDSRRAIRSEERRAERRTSGKDDREKEGFSDHERWSEEADERQRTSTVEAESTRRVGAAKEAGKGKGRAKRSVAVVVSADTAADLADDDETSGYRTEHASILSHLPNTHTSTTDSTDLFVLIFDPTLTSLPPLDYQPHGNGIPSTVGSTYSAISTPAATPGSELQSISPRIEAQDATTSSSQQAQPSKTFDLLYQQSLTLVSSPTHILPFTTPSGFVPILRHLAPNLVYVSDTLAGEEGANLAQLRGWVGNCVVVAGDQGTGGLADTETETEDERGQDFDGARERKRGSKWYERSEMVGLGKGVEVVDAARVGEDWGKRVGGRE